MVAVGGAGVVDAGGDEATGVIIRAERLVVAVFRRSSGPGAAGGDVVAGEVGTWAGPRLGSRRLEKFGGEVRREAAELLEKALVVPLGCGVASGAAGFFFSSLAVPPVTKMLLRAAPRRFGGPR